MASLFVDSVSREVHIVDDPVPGDFSFTVEQLRSARSLAYRDEADPLFFKWQAGEGTEVEWISKREEIRMRFAYPEV
jgi:hypothetical protein